MDDTVISLQSVSRRKNGWGCNEFGFEHTKLEMSAGHRRIVPHTVEFMNLEFVGVG